MTDKKPCRVKAKITRTVTEIAIVLLNRDGSINEVQEVLEELDMDDPCVLSVRDVISFHD